MSKAPTLKDAVDSYCGTTYAARLLGLSVGTIQSLVEKNELQAWKTQGGHRRISMPSIREYQRRQGIPVTEAEVSHEQLRVLVVDDDPVIRELFQGIAARSTIAMDMTVMSSGVEALLDLASLEPDVLIADLNMPGVDGFQVLRTLQNNPSLSRISALAMSSWTMQEIQARGGLPEGVIFMPKPLNLEWLNGYLAAIVSTHQTAKSAAR